MSSSDDTDSDFSWQVGACIVDHNNRIIGIGYNGMPVGCSDDELPWGKSNKLDNKDMYGTFGHILSLLDIFLH